MSAAGEDDLGAQEQAEDDAILLAAAPDLLAALKALVKEAQPPTMSGASGQVEFDDAFALAEKAIAKAEGE